MIVIRVINPDFPEPGYPGKPAVFQTQKPGFGSCSNLGFRVWNFLTIFHANDTFSWPKWTTSKTEMTLFESRGVKGHCLQ